jgi:hypothetical protein
MHRAEAFCHLARDGVGLVDLFPPILFLHRDTGKLGQDDGPQMVVVTSLEHLTPRPLWLLSPEGDRGWPSASLLYWYDLHDL